MYRCLLGGGASQAFDFLCVDVMMQERQKLVKANHATATLLYCLIRIMRGPMHADQGSRRVGPPLQLNIKTARSSSSVFSLCRREFSMLTRHCGKSQVSFYGKEGGPLLDCSVQKLCRGDNCGMPGMLFLDEEARVAARMNGCYNGSNYPGACKKFRARIAFGRSRSRRRTARCVGV